jgi:hypothetical protein
MPNNLGGPGEGDTDVTGHLSRIDRDDVELDFGLAIFIGLEPLSHAVKRGFALGNIPRNSIPGFTRNASI